ncbi:MAG: hypothetical protein IJA10_11540 [Lachnospiraceae bacterium]|nr:hypothetical protein [Lachnospiraceae bacterium]
MASMIPCFDCFSEDGKIDYGDFKPTSYPCCNCGSRVYKEIDLEDISKENDMGDLISRSALIEALDKRYNEKKEIVPDNLAEGFMQVEKLIKEQPTAYDVKKVVAELEQQAEQYRRRGFEHEQKGYSKIADKYYGKQCSYLHAIEIVRNGGKE